MLKRIPYFNIMNLRIVLENITNNHPHLNITQFGDELLIIMILDEGISNATINICKKDVRYNNKWLFSKAQIHLIELFTDDLINGSAYKDSYDIKNYMTKKTLKKFYKHY